MDSEKYGARGRNGERWAIGGVTTKPLPGSHAMNVDRHRIWRAKGLSLNNYCAGGRAKTEQDGGGERRGYWW